MGDSQRTLEDLARLVGADLAITAKTETSEERLARIEKDRLDDIERRKRENQTHAYGLVVLSLLLVISVAGATFGNEAQQKAGLAIAGAIVTACGGFVVGKSTKGA